MRAAARARRDASGVRTSRRQRSVVLVSPPRLTRRRRRGLARRVAAGDGVKYVDSRLSCIKKLYDSLSPGADSSAPLPRPCGRGGVDLSALFRLLTIVVSGDECFLVLSPKSLYLHGRWRCSVAASYPYPPPWRRGTATGSAITHSTRLAGVAHLGGRAEPCCCAYNLRC